MSLDFNPSTLSTLLRQRRLDRDELAEYLSTSLSRIEAFEAGTKTPTIRQIDLLAQLLGVNTIDFFGDEVVEVENDLIDFRTEQQGVARLSANGLRKVVRAERHAAFTKFLLSELKNNFVPALPRIKGDLSDNFAWSLREKFDDWSRGVRERERNSLLDESGFLQWLRIFVELQGSVTAIHDAPEKDYWGFYTDSGIDFPSIFINRSIQSKKSQLFTFCHEFAHYIEDSEGISNPYQIVNDTEIRCNRFAAEFISPRDKFSETIENFSRAIFTDTSTLVRKASEASLLSKQAAAVRLKELGYINKAQYNLWFKNNRKWYQKDKKSEQESAPIIPNLHHAKAIGEIGYLPIYLSSLAISRKIVDSFDVEHSLGISRAIQEKAFSLARRRIEMVLQNADKS